MKIAVVSNGAQSLLNFRGPLIAEMARRGHEVLAFAPDHNTLTREGLRDIGAEPIDFAMARSGTGFAKEVATIFELRRLFRQHRPNVAFSYFLKPVIYGTLSAWLAGVSRRYGLIAGLGFAFTEDGADDSQKRKVLQAVIGAMARFSCRRIDRIMFQNPDDLAEFVARKIVDPQKAALVGATGVDVDEWKPCPLPAGPVTFILVARLLRAKGIREYAEAARRVRVKYPDARFLLLGGIDDNPAAFRRAEVDGWVSEGLLEWPGQVSVRPWLAQSHVFVLPSYYREGVPRSTQEAMAMGRPVITTDLPGCRETIEHGVNGFIAQPRDSKSLAAAMEKFVDNRDLIEAMGKESRRMAEEKFDVRRLSADLLGIMGL